jgi:4-amino-4-deoxy-L-arabinose transferase-like glycosyltransferase
VKLFPLPSKIGWRDHVIGALLGSVYVGWLVATARTLGFARDEGFYFRAATTYWRWYDLLFTRPSDAFERRAIDSIWSENHEHPPLMKVLFGFSWKLFHEKWHLFSDASTAFRFPAMAMMGLAMWVTYLFGARAYSRRAGVIAALLLGLMPRVFYNAHLDCFDIPIVAMCTWTLYVYWRTQVEGGWLWAISAGVVFGLALATKHNAWFLPAVIVPHALLANASDPRGALAALKTARLPALVIMGVLGPLVWYALWPWMWHDLEPRFEEYFAFHVNHSYYNMEFLHVNYHSAPSPRLYMPVMILATVPTVTLVLFATGFFGRAAIHYRRLAAWVAAKRAKVADTTDAANVAKENASPADHDPETDLLFFLAIGVGLGPWLLTRTPIFGGTKHWMTAYPFLCLFAGYGFDWACTAMKRTLGDLRAVQENPRLLLGAQTLFAASVLAAPFAVTAHSHPFGLSSYVPLVGGTAGGADLGLNRQFWGFTTESLEPYFEAKAPRGASVYINDTAWDSWARLIDEKRIRPDLRGVGSISDADIAITHIELHMMEVEYKEWVVFGTDVPDYVLTHDGVPIIDVFRRKR